MICVHGDLSHLANVQNLWDIDLLDRGHINLLNLVDIMQEWSFHLRRLNKQIWCHYVCFLAWGLRSNIWAMGACCVGMGHGCCIVHIHRSICRQDLVMYTSGELNVLGNQKCNQVPHDDNVVFSLRCQRCTCWWPRTR